MSPISLVGRFVTKLNKRVLSPTSIGNLIRIYHCESVISSKILPLTKEPINYIYNANILGYFILLYIRS